MEFTTLNNNSQKYFLLALLLFLILPIPITLIPGHARLFFALTYTLLVAGGIQIVKENKRNLIIAVLLGITSFVLVWIDFFNENLNFPRWFKTISLLVFFGFIAIRLFKIVLYHTTVSLEIIYAAISGFLLLGLLGGFFFQTLELAEPSSFKLLTDNGSLFDLHYLSFVTLTSLGYGDVTPITQAGKTMTIVLSVAGQLYLTILVAILIGKYLAKEGAEIRE
jgi:hypothetical protein